MLTSQAVEFIADGADERPFFLFLSLHAPHAEPGVLGLPVAAPRHAGLFAGLGPSRPVSYGEEDVSDKPVWFADLPRASDPLGPFTFGEWSDGWRIAAVEALQAVDEAIGTIVDVLEAQGQTQDTVIVFSSDNGFSWDAHRLFVQKGCEFEECLRVPLAIRYPRWITAPRTDPRLVLNQDLAPTFAALAGTTPASAVNGSSLVPLLRNEPVVWRNDFLFENGDGTGARDIVGVRAPYWKYVEFAAPGGVELYDLYYDPHETQSYGFTQEPGYVWVRSLLQARLEQLLQE